jgi:toxin ParE1/3/4
MKILFTKPALEDIEAIRAYLAAHYPYIAPSVERRLRLAFARISEWPESAQPVVGRANVRMAPLVRYPYKIFYRVTSSAIEILHVSHSSQK